MPSLRFFGAALAAAALLVSPACSGKKKKNNSDTGGQTGSATLDANARSVLDRLVELETKKDVTCWTSFRQLDWFIAEKAMGEFGTLAKTRAIKLLARAAWTKASEKASGPAVTAADFDAAVKLPEVAVEPERRDELQSFANDIGLQNYTDYQKTTEHWRVVLALIQDEINYAAGEPLKPMSDDGLQKLADLSTTLSLMLLKKSGARAEADKTNLIEGEQVQAAYAEIARAHGLERTPRKREPLAAEQVKERLMPLTKSLIDGKTKALQSFNKTSDQIITDLNRVSRMKLTPEAVALFVRDTQSFIHFVAAGFEPMRADNYLSDGSFAKTRMPRLAYLDDSHVQNVITQLFPHHILTNGDVMVRFEPNPGPMVPDSVKREPFEIRMLDHEQNGVRDSAVQWLAMGNVWKERNYAMDPFAAEYLSEVASMMMTLFIRRGEELARAAGKEQIDLDVARKVRDPGYVQVPPHAPQTAEWTDERKKRKAELLAGYPKSLYTDVSKTSGLPQKPFGGPSLSGKVKSHGDVDVKSHGDVDVKSHGDVDVKSHGDVDVKSHGDVDVKSHGDMKSVQGHFDIQKIMGGGLAVGDINGDGYPDLFVNGEELGRLYLNRGKAGPGKFVDVTEKWGIPAGIDDGHGALFFDADGDGDLDLLVVRSQKPSQIFLLDGQKYTDATDRLGFKTHKGAHVAAIFDADGDGHLDIYIGYYGNHESNMGRRKERSLPSLDGLNGSPNQLWRRTPDGTYEEIGAKAGVADPGWTLAVSTFDQDMDGDLDLYLANDFGANRLFRSNGDGTFTDATAETYTGDRGSGMNVDFADINGDRRWDIYVTNIDMFSKRIKVVFPRDETTITIDEELARAFQYLSGNKLYVSSTEGELPFAAEEEVRFEPGDRGWGWDAAFFDYENDGDDDLYLTNGWIDGSYAGSQKNQMFINDQAFFYLGPESSAEAFPGNTRAAAAIDIDLDGDIDLVTTQFRAPTRVLRNDQKAGNRWLKLWLRGKAPNTGAIGALVTVEADGLTVLRQISCGRGYLSQADGSIALGAGKAANARVTIRWPDGKSQVIESLPTNKVHEIKQP
jgi:hypothetical protein